MADNFLFYKSWWDIIHECVPEDERKDFLYEIVRFGITGEMNTSANEMFMKQVQVQIDSAKSKHDKRVAAGRKGGQAGKGTTRNSGNKNAKKKNNSKTKANDNVNVNDNENDNNIINNLSIVNNSNIASPLPFNGQGSQLSLEALAELSNLEE